MNDALSIPGWTLTRQIGAGHFSTVYEGRPTDTAVGGLRAPSPRALKVTRLPDEEARRRLMNELAVLREIESLPYVVTVFDAFAVEEGPRTGDIVVVLDLADSTLEDAIGPQGANGVDVTEAFAQLAEGLHHLHAKALIHGDIKPANILQMGRVWKLTDFNVSVVLEGTHGYDDGGTLMYMSPQRLNPNHQRRRTVRPADDVWALGVVLHESLSGRHPFDRDIAAITQGQPRLSSRLPEPLRALVAKALAFDPRDRPTPLELRNDLLGLSASGVEVIPGVEAEEGDHPSAEGPPSSGVGASRGDPNPTIPAGTMPVSATVRQVFETTHVDDETEWLPPGAADETELPEEQTDGTGVTRRKRTPMQQLWLGVWLAVVIWVVLLLVVLGGRT